MNNRFDPKKYSLNDNGIPDQSSGVVGVRDATSVILRRKYVIVTFVIASFIILGFAVSSMTNTYTATAAIVLERNDTLMLEAVTQLESEQRDRTAIETEMDIITSRVFAGRVVDATNLVEHPWFNTYLRIEEERSQDSLERLLVFVKSVIASFIPLDRLAEPRSLPSMDVQRDRAISALLSRLGVSRSGESFAVAVRVSSPDPQLSAMLANTVANVYVEWSRELKKQAMTEAVDFLRERAEQTATRIAENERAIAEFTRINHLAPDERDDLLRKNIDEMSTELTATQVELATIRARQEQARRALAGKSTIEGTALDSTLLGSLRAEKSTLVRERAQHASNLGVNHPEVVDIDAELRSVNTMIDDEYRRILNDLTGEERIVSDRVAHLEAQVSAMQDTARERSVAEIRLRELRRELIADQKLHDMVVTRLGDLDPFAEITKPSARVVSVAEVPTEPSFPQKDRIMIGGALGSTVLAVILALLLEAGDTRIRSGHRIRQITRLANLASVPKSRNWSRGNRQRVRDLVERPRSVHAEALRSLYLVCRSQLSAANPVILVTAPLPGDGVSSVALGLAVSAARDGVKTIYLDFDPLMTNASGGSSDLPVIDASGALADPIHQPVELDRLEDSSSTGLHCGKVKTLMQTKDVQLLLEKLRASYELIVIDSAPVLVTEDANWISPLADAVLLVARFGSTTEQQLASAVSRLRLNRAPLLGTVLNRVNPRTQSSGEVLGAISYRRQARAYLVN